jgi:formate/nitrite transporter
MVQTPPQTFQTLAEKGETFAKMSALKTLWSSTMGGCYVGMSGLLSLVIAGNLSPGNLTAQVMIFAALFPINLLLVLQSGGQLFTGNTASMSMAYFENKVTVPCCLRNWLISYTGNIIGCCTLAFVASYLGLFSGGAQDMAIRVAVRKTSATFGQTLVKGMMCNWLVCMAVWLATSAQDLGSKMVGIWFPISMFIMIGFEHSVANLFMLPAGLLAGAPLSISDIIFKNLIPVTIGNAISGTVIIGAGFSFAYGRLGAGSAGSFRGIANKLSGK